TTTPDRGRRRFDHHQGPTEPPNQGAGPRSSRHNVPEPSGPNSAPGPPVPRIRVPHRDQLGRTDGPAPTCRPTNRCSTLSNLPGTLVRGRPLDHLRGQMLLRKEVIQPHLPVRLPCYDLVPITGPTFDGSLPKRGWATGFGCYRLS